MEEKKAGKGSGRVEDHPSSVKNQEKLRTNQPQCTPARDYGCKRKFRVSRFVAHYIRVRFAAADALVSANTAESALEPHAAA